MKKDKIGRYLPSWVPNLRRKVLDLESLNWSEDFSKENRTPFENKVWNEKAVVSPCGTKLYAIDSTQMQKGIASVWMPKSLKFQEGDVAGKIAGHRGDDPVAFIMRPNKDAIHTAFQLVGVVQPTLVDLEHHLKPKAKRLRFEKLLDKQQAQLVTIC